MFMFVQKMRLQIDPAVSRCIMSDDSSALAFDRGHMTADISHGQNVMHNPKKAPIFSMQGDREARISHQPSLCRRIGE